MIEKSLPALKLSTWEFRHVLALSLTMRHALVDGSALRDVRS